MIATLRQCKYCEQDMTVTRTDHVFCSPRCNKGWRTHEKTKQEVEVEIPCEICKAYFYNQDPRSRCCSSECRMENIRRHRASLPKPPLLKKACKNCGELFTPKTTNAQIHCTHKCAHNTGAEDCRQRIIESFDEYKMKKGCTDCGYAEHPKALRFDHITNHRPVWGGRRVTMNGLVTLRASKEILDKTIKDCEVRCRNCMAVKYESAIHG